MLYDVFVSHASEDKDKFVRPLAKRLSDNRIQVWYDEFTLKPGDSIRRSIDMGIAKSRYGIVILSKAFFQKEWTQWELDGLIQRLNRSENNIIIPIWHDVSFDDILKYSPSLADRKAILSSNGLEYIVSEITKIVKPEGSTLLNARDILIDYKMNPPVVTDDWWLDVVAFSTLDFRKQPWGFPISDSFPKSKKIAWAAMQQTWQQKRKEKNISQMSRPEEVLNFIKESSGLEEICYLHPDYLAAYVPQLTIKGYGAQFEAQFEKMYQKSQISLKKQAEKDKANKEWVFGPSYGCSANPECYLNYALRHPKFGSWKPFAIADAYMNGGGMIINAKIYSSIDYLIWLLSDKSNWLPNAIHQYLLEGFKYVNWNWYSFSSFPFGDEKSFNEDGITGELAYVLQNTRSYNEFILTEKCESDIKARIKHSKHLLYLHEPVKELFEKFIAMKFIENWFLRDSERKLDYPIL